MFEDPHMTYLIAKQRHEKLLAESEEIRRFKALSPAVKKKNRRIGNIVLPIADLLIAIGVALKERWGAVAEGIEDTVGEGSEP